MYPIGFSIVSKEIHFSKCKYDAQKKIRISPCFIIQLLSLFFIKAKLAYLLRKKYADNVHAHDVLQKEKTMKTNLKRFALIACIIPFCSCGANLPLNSTDRESTLQPILNQTLTETSAYNVPPSQSKKGDRIFIIRSPFFLIMH